MSIGTTIKKLRLEKNLTQETLADYLGISSRAVSQWERDKTSPDISQLPLLANIFGVSTDVILGVDIEKNNEKINEYLTMAQEAGHCAEHEKRTSILREALLQFPRSYRIMERLANAIVCEYSRKGINDYEEVFTLCNRILDECTDSGIRNDALDLLGAAYGYAGKTEELLKVAEQKTPIPYSREVFMLYKWDHKGSERKDFLSYLLSYTSQTLGLIPYQINEDGKYSYSLDERIELWKLRVALIELFFPDGDYCNYAQDAEISCRFLTSAYLSKGDTESAIFWLSKGADFAIHFDTYDFDSKHTSPAFRDLPADGWIMEGGCNDSARLYDYIKNDTETESIRDDPRVRKILERTEKTAKRL